MTDFASGSGLSSSAGATFFTASVLASFVAGVAEVAVLAGVTGVFNGEAVGAATRATGSW